MTIRALLGPYGRAPCSWVTCDLGDREPEVYYEFPIEEELARALDAQMAQWLRNENLMNAFWRSLDEDSIVIHCAFGEKKIDELRREMDVRAKQTDVLDLRMPLREVLPPTIGPIPVDEESSYAECGCGRDPGDMSWICGCRCVP